MFNNNNNNNCLKSNIQCIEIRVQWTVHLGSSHMHVHAVTRVHAVTPKLVICVMYLTSIWRILLMTDGLNAVWSNDRAAHTDTNPKNLELAPPQSITATRLDQLVYSPNYYIQIFQTQNNCPQWEANLHPARSESWAFATTPRELYGRYSSPYCSILLFTHFKLLRWISNIEIISEYYNKEHDYIEVVSVYYALNCTYWENFYMEFRGVGSSLWLSGDWRLKRMINNSQYTKIIQYILIILIILLPPPRFIRLCQDETWIQLN